MEKQQTGLVIAPKLNEVAALYHNPRQPVTGLELRRQMLEVPEVAQALGNIEKYVFAASAKQPIEQIDDATLVQKTAQMFKYIAMDVGYKIPQDPTDWTYICARLLGVVKKYYMQLSLAEIKLAFELCATGELDGHLPRDSYGKPDKNHYQQFSVEYFCKIVNAYKAMRGGVITKAYKQLPYPEKKMSREEVVYYNNLSAQKHRTTFLRYKYTGQLTFDIGEEMLLYKWLLGCGLAEKVEETEEDRQQAFARYMRRAANGFVNKYTAEWVRKQGTESKELDYTAFEIARFKEIRRAFKRMVEDEISIDDYIKFEKV